MAEYKLLKKNSLWGGGGGVWGGIILFRMDDSTGLLRRTENCGDKNTAVGDNRSFEDPWSSEKSD